MNTSYLTRTYTCDIRDAGLYFPVLHASLRNILYTKEHITDIRLELYAGSYNDNSATLTAHITVTDENADAPQRYDLGLAAFTEAENITKVSFRHFDQSISSYSDRVIVPDYV